LNALKQSKEAGRGASDLPIQLDRTIRTQSGRVHAALRSAIVDGRLRPGLKLPSSRGLAAQLGMRRNSIVAAYEQLLSDGLIEARHGAGTFVATRLPTPQKRVAAPAFNCEPKPRQAFALGHTLIDTSLLRSLGAALSRHVSNATAEQLGYGDPRGSRRLRSQIAEYLAERRGMRTDPECVVVVNGTQNGLRLCADALLARGDVVWMEDPGYYAARTTFSAAGLKIVPIPVDEQGMIVPRGSRGSIAVKAAYVTPSHQFPTGVTMSMERRIALLDWVRASNAWIFEDDYDSEFRYAGPPLTALAGLGSDRVIYIGTFTKTLFASLRLAYLALPPQIVERVVSARASHDRFPPLFMQDAVADLMADGKLANHVRRARRLYCEARDCVAAALTKASDSTLDVRVPSQGLHLVAYLPTDAPRHAAREIRAVAGVETRLISEASITAVGRDGFIVGFAGHPPQDLNAAAKRLGQAAASYLGRTSR
jgi:GntR family transcriptional regulator/MocR family aminotransferase